MHAFGAHLPLEKCKKPRTGRGFLQIDEGRVKSLLHNKHNKVFRQYEQGRQRLCAFFASVR